MNAMSSKKYQKNVYRVFLCTLVMLSSVCISTTEKAITDQDKTKAENKARYLVKEMDQLLNAVAQGKSSIDLLPSEDKSALITTLSKVLMRAIREDGLGASDPLNPVPWFDSADLDEIRRCVCLIKNTSMRIESKVCFIESLICAPDLAITTSILDEISSNQVTMVEQIADDYDLSVKAMLEAILFRVK